jgi:hypothetical protein
VRGLAAGLLLLCCAAAPADAAKSPARPCIDPLDVRRHDDRVAVSFHVANGLGEDTLGRIRAGLPVAQRHRVDILGRRSAPLWTAKVHARMRIDTSAVYDSLTHRYDLERTIRLMPRKQKKQAIVTKQHQSTDSIAEVRAWMTEFDALPPLELPESALDARLRVRVESTLGRRFVLYMFPARLTVSAERKLEP